MRWFKNLRIGTKIISLVVIMALFMSGIGLFSYSQLGDATERLDNVYEQNLLPVGWINLMRADMRNSQQNLLEFILEDDQKNREDSLKEIAAISEDFSNLLSNYETSQLDAVEKEKLKIVKENLTKYRDEREKVIEIAKTGNQDAAFAKYKELKQYFDPMQNSLIELSEYNSKSAEEANLQNQEASATANILLLAVILSIVLISILLGWFISRLISKPLNTMVKGVNEIAKGNLTIEEADNVIDYHDEVGQLGKSLQIMVKNLRELITHVSEATDKVAASSEELSASTEQNKQATTQIASSIQEVSSGADTQVKEIDEVVKTMEVMSQGIQRLAETSGVVSESSKETATAAENGNESIQNAVTKLNKQSQEIGNIVNVITGISDQTHLLALNAAIEAAHAGDLGKGFAVVASEVKKLAEQSKESENQIASLVKEVQQGMIDVQKVGEAFHDIVSKAQHVANEIEKVSASTEEMSANSQEVTASIEQMGQIAKDSASNTQNVASASEEQLASFEEITASADALGHMATELQQLISKFKV